MVDNMTREDKINTMVIWTNRCLITIEEIYGDNPTEEQKQRWCNLVDEYINPLDMELGQAPFQVDFLGEMYCGDSGKDYNQICEEQTKYILENY